MELADKDVKTLIQNALPEIKTQMLEEMKRQLAWTIGNQLAEHTKESVTAFIKSDIAPEMQKHLQENKAAILEGVLTAIDGIIAEVSQAIIAKAKGNLSQSYKRDRIVEEIFK